LDVGDGHRRRRRIASPRPSVTIGLRV
jgi:hypothetical protein